MLATASALARRNCHAGVRVLLAFAAVVVPAAAAAGNELAAGIALYEKFEFEKALAAFKAVADDAAAEPAARARMYMGLCHSNLGQIDAGRIQFAAALAADPGLKLPAGASPKIAEAFEEERKLVLKARARLRPVMPASPASETGRRPAAKDRTATVKPPASRPDAEQPTTTPPPEPGFEPLPPPPPPPVPTPETPSVPAQSAAVSASSRLAVGPEFWIAGGVTVVAAVVGTAFMVKGSGERSNFQYEDSYASFTAGGVFIAIAAVGATATVASLFFHPFSGRGQAPQVALVPGPGSVSLAGRF